MLITRWRRYVFFAYTKRSNVNVFSSRGFYCRRTVRPVVSEYLWRITTMWSKIVTIVYNRITVSEYWPLFSSSNERGPGSFPPDQLLPVTADVASVSPSIVYWARLGLSSLIGRSVRLMSKKKPPKIGIGYWLRRIKSRLHGTKRSAEHLTELHTEYSNRPRWSWSDWMETDSVRL